MNKKVDEEIKFIVLNTAKPCTLRKIKTLN